MFECLARQMVRVALWNTSCLGHQRESATAEIADCRRRRDAIECGPHLRPDISAELREESRDSPVGAHFRDANVFPQPAGKISVFGRITDRFTAAKTMRQSGDRRQRRSHGGHARAGGNDVGGSFCRKHPGIIRCHGADNRDTAPAGLARQRAAGIPVPPGSERGPAHEYVRLNLAKPTQQPRQRLRFVLAEEIVAAGQCDVYREPGRFQSPAWAHGARRSARVPARPLLRRPGQRRID